MTESGEILMPMDNDNESFLDMNAGGDADQAVVTEPGGPPETVETAEPAADWEEMTEEQKEASVEMPPEPGTEPQAEPGEATAEAAETTGTEAETEQTAPDDDQSVGDDAAGAAAEADVDGEGVGADQTAGGDADWLDEATRDYAEMMGVDADLLAALPNREALDRVCRAIDKRAFEAAKTAETQETAPEVETKPKEERKLLDSRRQAEETGGSLEERLDAISAFFHENYEDDEAASHLQNLVREVKGTAENLDSLHAEMAQMREERQRESQSALQRQATDSLHSLGFTELFGTPGETPTQKQAENIQRVLDQHFENGRARIAAGRQVAPTPAFLKADAFYVFGDELLQQKEKQIIEKVKRGSSARTGGTGAKHIPKEAPENESREEFMQRMAEDPDVVRSAKRLGIPVS